MLVDLSRTAVAEPLRTLARERQSGDLVVRSGRVVKTLFFDCGRLVFAASNLKRDRLGEALMELGRISQDEFQRATALMHEEGHRRRFGEALVEAGVMDENEIGRSVARQVDRIAHSLFRFDEGVADFEERTCTIPMDFMVNISLHRILLEGIAILKRPEVVAAGLGDLDRPVSVDDAPPFSFDPESLTALELDVLEAARGGGSLRTLVSGSEGPEFPRMRAAYALLASGVLAEAAGEDEGRAVPEVETGTFLLSTISKQPELSEPVAIVQEVKEELTRSASLDYEEWLKVSSRATRAELIHALEEKMDRYHLIAATAEGHRQLQHDVDVIIGRAWSLLRRLQQEQEAAGEEVPRTDDFTPPPTAYGVDTSVPVGPDVAALTDMGFRVPTSSDQLLRDGEAAMAVADYARAVEIYQQLVDRSPDVANFRARLAVAMASYPLTAQKAERQFQEALRLEPDRTDLHYRLGIYYKHMRQKARAISCLQTVLKLDARHALARKELEELAPGEARGGIRKLFRR